MSFIILRISMSTEMLMKVLKSLIPYWDMAEGFLLMLEEDKDDEELVSNLKKLIIPNIKKIEDKNKVQKITNTLNALKEKERKENLHNKKDIEELEDLIAGLE